MCGILCQFNVKAEFQPSLIHHDRFEVAKLIQSSDSGPDIYQSLVPKICARGPDFCGELVTSHSRLFSSVLSLRSPFTKQPLVSSRYVLQFNGELYNDDLQGNDTMYILEKLQSSSDVIKTVRQLDGEFAYVIWDKEAGKVFFGRDPIGKRSLVYRFKGEEGDLIVSSVNPSSKERKEFTDCKNGSIYELDTRTQEIIVTPWDKQYTINPNIDHDFSHVEERLTSLQTMLYNAVKSRIETIQPLNDVIEPHALYSLLFSGGLDCTVIAGIASTLSKPDTIIDLLNVGFNNPRSGLKADEAPDRILARSSWLELSKLYPHITFNLVEVNVTYEEYLDAKPRVMELMYPKNTEMDLSIAIAFYFASRGEGVKNTLIKGEVVQEGGYKSPAKVLLSGLGADELYGGYHKFNSKNLETLVPELFKQINGIHERNLQRDDKVIAHNGVEVRYPFLADDVIEYSTSQLEINYKVAKYILRQLARRINLDFVADEKKRAIQFGAKSAKMTKDGSKKGDTVVI